MKKMSTMIWMCILLLISISCLADPTGREPQLMGSNGQIAATNTVTNTANNTNIYPKSDGPISATAASNTSVTTTTSGVATNANPSPNSKPAVYNSPNPADILNGGPANDNEVMPPRTPVSPDAIVTDTINTMMYRNRIPGVAVALYVDGRPYLYHFGFANLATRQPVTENTIFEIGSITKTFTALLLGMELDQGRMHLQDSVFKYASSLQRLTGSVNNITLEQLATHTSSLPYQLPDYMISSQQLFCNFLNSWRPGTPMGSTWKYSNIGFGLLGYMLEGATAESYDQLLHQRVLNPLGMYHTAIEVPPQLENDYAQGYGWDDSPAKQWRHNDIIPAEGAIKTTSQDMLKYLLASLGVPGTPLDIFSGIRTTCYTYVATRYGLQGLAWEKHPLYSLNDYGYINRTRVLFLRDSYASPVSQDDPTSHNENMLIDKTGTTAGFTAYMALIPTQKIGIVILTNRVALRQQIGLAGRSILLRLMDDNPQVYYKPYQPQPSTVPTFAVSQNITHTHVNPHYYATPMASLPPTPVVVKPKVKVRKKVITHSTVHHRKHVVVHETVNHHGVVKKKIIVKKHKKIVKKTVTVVPATNTAT